MNLSEHIEQYLQYIADRRRFSPRTIDTYRKSLTKFIEHLGEGAAEFSLNAFSESSVKTFVWDLKKDYRKEPGRKRTYAQAPQAPSECSWAKGLGRRKIPGTP